MDPTVISHYRIISKLGSGGMGEVFLAEDTKLDRKVAIKMLPEGAIGDEQAKLRLIREAKAAATLDHPNICGIHEVGEDGDRTFIVMQYVEGEVLARKILGKPLAITDVVEIGCQATDALAEAHARGIIHRDIKPHNIILTPRGQVKILDFGLAKFMPEGRAADPGIVTEHRLTETGQVVGTPGYMSPEQLQGEPIDARSDLFSLGVLLYECATGRHAFAGMVPFQISLQVVSATPPKPSVVNSSIPAAFDKIIGRAMAKTPAARYESAAAFHADLSNLRKVLKDKGETGTLPLNSRDSLSTRVMPSFASAKLSETSSRTKAYVAIAIASVIALIALWFAGSALFGSRAEVPPAEAKQWYDRGTIAIREGAYYQASKALERAAQVSPNFALAHARLADAYAEIDQTDKAREELLLAISLVGNRSSLSSADSTYLDAVAATLRRDFPEAIKSYQAIADQSSAPEKASALVDLGRAYEKNENTEKAIAQYTLATQLDPQSAAGFLRAGILYGRKQELAKATEAFRQAENIYQAMSSQEGLGEVYYQRGSVSVKTRKLEDARTQLGRALEIAKGSANKFQMVRTQLQLSGVDFAEGNTEQAKKTAAEAISAAQAANIRNLATNGLIDLGYTLLSRGEFVEARSYFSQALEFAQQDKAKSIEARAKLALGSLNIQQDNRDEAILLLDEALKFFQPAGYRKETSNALILLARAHRDKGEYDVALKTFEQQLEIATKLDDPARVAAAQSSIGILLGEHLERYPEAIPHLEESYRLNKSLGAKTGMGWDLMNRAAFLCQLGRHSEAETALNEAYAIATRPEASLKSQLAWVELTRAQVALTQGRLAVARAKAQATLDLAGTQYSDIAAQAKQSLALSIPNAIQARRLGEEAVTASRELKSPRMVSTSLLVLSDILLRQNDGQGALAKALEAEKMFAAAGQLDSDWRALTIAARASDMTGDRAGAEGYAGRAVKQMESLKTRWGAEAYASYAERADIKVYLKQLEQLLARSK